MRLRNYHSWSHVCTNKKKGFAGRLTVPTVSRRPVRESGECVFLGCQTGDWRKWCLRVLQIPLMPAIQTWNAQTLPGTECTYFHTPNSHLTTSSSVFLDNFGNRCCKTSETFWHIKFTSILSSCTEAEAWITHLNITYYLFDTGFSWSKSVFSENKHPEIMAENKVTLITWEKIMRELLFITAVLLDLHSVLFATEGVQ